MRNTRGITPIISVILLLMMTVAVAGLAWVWLSGMTTSTMETTKNMTDRQINQMMTIIDIADYDIGCVSNIATNVTLQVFNKGTTTIDVNSVVIDGNKQAATQQILPGSIESVTVTNVPAGLNKTNSKSASVMLVAAQGYNTKTINFAGSRCD